ncbi:MAG: rhodanese-like domain-containing protein [Myxococcales bacterium]|nr:rhodanese-like domain-containing protein [Myxococcales bacterium]
MLGLPPEIANHASRYLLVDVRPREERYCGLGLIPGALAVRPSLDLPGAAAELARLADGREPVLVCLTGERARAHALGLARAVDAPLVHLAGGLLGWMAAGLPVTGQWAQGGPALSYDPRFPRDLHAELMRLLVDDPLGAETAARWVLLKAEQELGQPIDARPPRRMHRLLELVGSLLVELGVPRFGVAAMMDQMLTRLPSPVPGFFRPPSDRRATVELARVEL